MKVFLIRHGEQKYPYNEQGEKMVSGPGAPLVELGWEQLRQLGEELIKGGQRLDAIYISPLLRAQQSAEALAEVVPVSNMKTINDLREVDPCSAIGHTYKELEAIDGDIYAHPFSEDQETLDHLIEREREAMREIFENARKHGFESIAIIGHGDPLCALDWSLKNEGYPISYAEMKKGFYPQKGEAYFYTISQEEPIRIVGEGKTFSAEYAKNTLESFRYAKDPEVE